MVPTVNAAKTIQDRWAVHFKPRDQRTTARSVNSSAATWREAHLDIASASGDDRGHDSAVVRVAHQLGFPIRVLGGVAFLNALALGCQVLSRCLAVRTAGFDVHNYCHGLLPAYPRKR